MSGARAYFRRRSTFSRDPNNKAWSASTSKYGHRILAAQGWRPGATLGAENASHADQLTVTNASPVRILPRQENLGLGAKVGNIGRAETFGLSTLSGIFGRLNGETDADVQAKQGKLRDAKLESYQAQKYGFMQFVSGGLLVRNGVTSTQENKTPSVAPVLSDEITDPGLRRGKKRKVQNNQVEDDSGKRQESMSRPQAVTEAGADVDSAGSVPHTSVPHESKKRTNRDRTTVPDSESKLEGLEHPIASATTSSHSSMDGHHKCNRVAKGANIAVETSTAVDGRGVLKHERRARKAIRRKRHDEKHRRKAEKTTLSSEQPSSSLFTNATGSGMATAVQSHHSTLGQFDPRMSFGSSRHAVRQRYIQQKRMASTDPQALKEILMLKVAG